MICVNAIQTLPMPFSYHLSDDKSSVAQIVDGMHDWEKQNERISYNKTYIYITCIYTLESEHRWKKHFRLTWRMKIPS